MKRAFTLIELLVVIAIIAILAAILFPVFAQAKRAAKDAVALSNTKQTATSSYLYSGDSDDVVVPWESGVPIPGGTAYLSWAVLTFPYTKSTDIQWDPAKQRTVDVAPQPWLAAAPAYYWGLQIHMAINRSAYACRPDTGRLITQTSFQAPAERIAFAFSERQSTASVRQQHWLDATRSPCPSLANDPGGSADNDKYNAVARAAIRYHNDGVLAAYADGHAKKTPYKRLITRNNATFADSGACEYLTFSGPDGVYGTGDDLDNEVTRAWGRYYDDRY